MKRYHLLGWLSAGFLIFTPTLTALAAEEASVASPQTRPATVGRMAYGADDILKLSRAQISDDIIATYIQTSGTTYTLRPNDIVQLHSQGVSDRIITLMLAQGRVVAEPTNAPVPLMPMVPVVAAVAAAPAPAQQAAADTGLFIPGQNAAEIAAACQPVVQDAASTLYVIPYSGSCGYRPTYSVYGGGCYPSYGYNAYGYNAGYVSSSYTVRLGGGHRYHSYHRR